jgi:hypothetical protein
MASDVADEHVLNGSSTPCETPTTPTVELGRAIINALAIDCDVPTHSIAASTPCRR